MAPSSSPPEPGSPLDPTPASPPSPSAASPAVAFETTDDNDHDNDESRQRSSTASSRVRRASVRILGANPPMGMWHATGHVAAKAPTLSDIRHGSFTHKGWSAEGQRSRSRSISSTTGPSPTLPPAETTARAHKPSVHFPGAAIPETRAEHKMDRDIGGRRSGVDEDATHHHHDKTATVDTEKIIAGTLTHEAVSAELHDGGSSEPAKPRVTDSGEMVYPNGYKPPPKHTWGQATVIAAKGFGRFVTTPMGFLITLYGLNVVAWGGMLFLLLVEAAPAMCRPTCGDINSPRRKWVEVDSQILNALFCVTGFGLIPWRFRDLYYLLRWRLMKRVDGLRTLGGIHRGWFRLPGSDKLPPTMAGANIKPAETDTTALPLPVSKVPDPPLTGTRAPPTKTWKLDFVIWMYVLNTFLQAVLCGFMWGYNRYDRPSWSTGTFVALACIVAGVAGLMVFWEGKRVKKIEGVPVTEDDLAIIEDMERGRKH